jgi:hypothetical protein
MGQYWKLVNLDKKEFVHPHEIGCGLKLGEMVAASPGIPAAMVMLCAAMPVARGGGDFREKGIVGRWAGDRIALVGDYAEDGDLAPEHEAASIYKRCVQADDAALYPERYEGVANRYTDISAEVAEMLEREFEGEFRGTGWREFVRNS